MNVKTLQDITALICLLMMLRLLTRQCISFCVAQAWDLALSKSMSVNFLRFRASCMILKLWLSLKTPRKDGQSPCDRLSPCYMQVKYQSGMYLVCVLQEHGLRLLAVVPVAQSRWSNCSNTLFPSSKEQLVESLRALRPTIFSAKSEKLWLLEVYVVPL